MQVQTTGGVDVRVGVTAGVLDLVRVTVGVTGAVFDLVRV